MAPKTTYVTGGASGIGLAVAQSLNKLGTRVAVADINLQAAQEVVDSLDANSGAGQKHLAVQIDAASWESQAEGFKKAVDSFERIDVVIANAGIVEGALIPHDGGTGRAFVKPNLTALDVNLNGFLYTATLGIQQLRRQDIGSDGFRGKIIGTASICGIYCVPTLPIYTASKHGVVGFVRSYGKYLPEENITLNAVCPHVTRTNLLSQELLDNLEKSDLLTPMDGVVGAFQQCIDSDMSGECIEIGPAGGAQVREPPALLNPESGEVNKILNDLGRLLHEKRS